MVEGFNDVVSEFVKGFNDLSEDALVSEVLGGGELDKGTDDGTLLDLVPAGLGDSVDGTLELLNLGKSWVVEGLDQFEGIIDGSGGLVVLGDEGLVVFVILFSDEGDFSDGVSVIFKVLFDLVDVSVDLGVSWLEEVWN